MSKDPLWVDTFKAGGDLHSVLCSETFDIPISDVKTPFYANKDLTFRDVQKTINFGLAYGMSEFKLADTILVSVKEARDIIDKFFSKVRKVEKFLNSNGMFARKNGYMFTPMPYNRVRLFPKWNYLKDNPGIPESDKWLGSIERAGKNSQIQGCNGDIIKRALVDTNSYIQSSNIDAFLLLSVYDEIQSEANRNIAEDWRDTLQSIMIKAAEVVLKEVPVVVDVKITECWEK